MADVSLTANESIVIQEIFWEYVLPNEMPEMGDDTEFEGPYGEIQNYIMRR